MLIRALIVLLIALNIGVTAWWAAHEPETRPPAEPLSLGVARLQLASEVAPTATAEPTPTAESDAASTTVQCVSLGPFTGPDLIAAQAALQTQARRIVPREQAEGAARGWRVYLPPLDSTEAIEAAATRIAAAGFSDYFIVREGVEANSLALGRYAGEQAARNRADALSAKGFAVRAAPLGAEPPSAWLDVVLAPGKDPARAQEVAQSPQALPIDCDTLQSDPQQEQ
jgi:hypothetical protein